MMKLARTSWLGQAGSDKLARPANIYNCSMFARRLLDAFSMYARCLLDDCFV